MARLAVVAMTGAQLELRAVCIEGAEVMPEFLVRDVHEITAKQRTNPGNRGAVRLAHLKWIGLLPKRLWLRHSEIREWSCPCMA